MFSSIATRRIVTQVRPSPRFSSFTRNQPSFSRCFSTRRYTKEHEWIEVKGNEGTIGISDFAQNALGDVVYVDLPDVGKKVAKKESVVAVESVKAASDVYSPASGEVLAVNENLRNDPSLVNKSPFQDGWMVRLKLNNPSEVDSLMDEAAYKQHCDAESKNH